MAGAWAEIYRLFRLMFSRDYHHFTSQPTSFAAGRLRCPHPRASHHFYCIAPYIDSSELEPTMISVQVAGIYRGLMYLNEPKPASGHSFDKV
jgi:hypothetical protein